MRSSVAAASSAAPITAVYVLIACAFYLLWTPRTHAASSGARVDCRPYANIPSAQLGLLFTEIAARAHPALARAASDMELAQRCLSGALPESDPGCTSRIAPWLEKLEAHLHNARALLTTSAALTNTSTDQPNFIGPGFVKPVSWAAITSEERNIGQATAFALLRLTRERYGVTSPPFLAYLRGFDRRVVHIPSIHSAYLAGIREQLKREVFETYRELMEHNPFLLYLRGPELKADEVLNAITLTTAELTALQEQLNNLDRKSRETITLEDLSPFARMSPLLYEIIRANPEHCSTVATLERFVEDKINSPLQAIKAAALAAYILLPPAYFFGGLVMVSGYATYYSYALSAEQRGLLLLRGLQTEENESEFANIARLREENSGLILNLALGTGITSWLRLAKPSWREGGLILNRLRPSLSPAARAD